MMYMPLFWIRIDLIYAFTCIKVYIRPIVYINLFIIVILKALIINGNGWNKGELQYMEVVIYIFIFIIGTLIGSFASLATYRIPLKQDILIKHSYCPVCKEKLVLKDLIPIFSYVFLGGKCSHCGEKIKIRYLVLEVVSGILFLLFALSFNIDFSSINLKELVYFLFITVFFVTLVIIAGIDKENRKIDNSVILFGIVVTALYSSYLVFLNGESNINQIIISLLAVLIYALNMYVVKTEKFKYIVNFILVVLLSSSFANLYIIPIALFLAAIVLLLHKIFAKSKPAIAYYYIICFATIFISYNFIM